MLEFEFRVKCEFFSRTDVIYILHDLNEKFRSNLKLKPDYLTWGKLQIMTDNIDFDN